MRPHIQTGKKGEELAIEWLKANGYAILSRNWRYGRHEIDIIASKQKILHIIEVKSRRSTTYGQPEESVGRKKIQHIMQGASGWLLKFPGHKRIQYDVLSIVLSPEPEFFLIEDVCL
ncbi:MAG: YraN family protein [Bacteroidetes bacterium]|nr:YraN family protein [Bacteroidota bacterium]